MDANYYFLRIKLIKTNKNEENEDYLPTFSVGQAQMSVAHT